MLSIGLIGKHHLLRAQKTGLELTSLIILIINTFALQLLPIGNDLVTNGKLLIERCFVAFWTKISTNDSASKLQNIF